MGRLIVFVVLMTLAVPAPALAFELIEAYYALGTASLNAHNGSTSTRDTALFATGGPVAYPTASLDLEFDGTEGGVAPIHLVDGSITLELEDWRFRGQQGNVSGLVSTVHFDSFQVTFSGDPIARVSTAATNQSANTPYSILFRVVGTWSLGDHITPFDLTVPSGHSGSQAINQWIQLSSEVVALDLSPLDLGGITYTPTIMVRPQVIVTPEPTTALLLGLGFAILGWNRRSP